MVGARSKSVVHNSGAGAALRAARLHRRISLTQAGVDLRIPPAQLKSLEDGDLSSFSAEVYARGAYRKYARYLDIETEQTHRAFLRSLSGARELVPLRLPQTASWLQRFWTPTGVVLTGIAGAVLVVASYLAWQVQTFVRLPALVLDEPTAMVVEGHNVVAVRGEAEVGVSVTVNEEVVLTDEEGAFSFDLPVRPGINMVRATATGASGRTRVIERRLLVPRS